MRIYLKLTQNTEAIPFNYQQLLTGVIHKWIGPDNHLHGKPALHSFSWLQNMKPFHSGLYTRQDSYFFISAHDPDLLKTMISNIQQNPAVCCGMLIREVHISEESSYSNRERFETASPVLIKRRIGERDHHILYDNPQAGNYLTETLQKKLSNAGLSPEGVKITFDTTYHNPQTKVVHYKSIQNKANICPVIIEGSSEQIAFARNVGIGNSTGIGFGALK